jgi:hypothetical protein
MPSLMVGHYRERRRWGGQVNKANEGGVDRWSVRHGAEVGGDSAWRGGARGRQWREEEERRRGEIAWRASFADGLARLAQEERVHWPIGPRKCFPFRYEFRN